MFLIKPKILLFSAFLLVSIAIFPSCGSDSDTKQAEADALLHTIAHHEKSTGSINAKNSEGFYPVTYASYFGSLNALEYVINKGADLNVVDDFGYTALHWVSMKGHLEATMFLINAGADVHAQNKLNETPVFLAFKYEFPELVRLLLEAGADLGAETSYNQTAILMGTSSENPEMAEIIRENVGIGIKSVAGYPRANSFDLDRQLRVAAAEGRPKDITALLERGANINSRSAFGRSSLIFAAEAGHYNVVQELLAYQEVNLAFRDRYNRDAVAYARDNGFPHVAEYILLAQQFRSRSN